ncbi:hypothetical protein C2G38_2193449 [Gigaspora rosea]|uniref:Uncharacterized protein n=1 Tax=Gigaspora rosea TaxID=44941 RepID=A0A397V054_9GLOM|nr:hypothetical protein C2G38_2193449 [Gigaspora rosea]
MGGDNSLKSATYKMRSYENRQLYYYINKISLSYTKKIINFKNNNKQDVQRYTQFFGTYSILYICIYIFVGPPGVQILVLGETCNKKGFQDSAW